MKSLARKVDSEVSCCDWGTTDHRVLLAACEIRPYIDHFPDDEVDSLFVEEIRRRIAANGDRVAAVGKAIRVNLLYPETWPDHLVETYKRWKDMLAAF
jgi:hypothetical protein